MNSVGTYVQFGFNGLDPRTAGSWPRNYEAAGNGPGTFERVPSSIGRACVGFPRTKGHAQTYELRRRLCALNASNRRADVHASNALRASLRMSSMAKKKKKKKKVEYGGVKGLPIPSESCAGVAIRESSRCASIAGGFSRRAGRETFRISSGAGWRSIFRLST